MKVPQSLRDLMEGAMNLVYVEDLSSKKGLLQAINPLAKLIAVVSMIVVSLLIFDLTHILIICLVPIVLAVASRIPMRHFFSRTAFVFLLSVLISIPFLFYTAGVAIWSANLGIATLSITIEGLTKFLVFTLRVWFCVACLMTLILSTGFDRLLRLLSDIRVPYVVVQLFSLTYRYFFVSVREAQSVLMAKESRTYLHNRNLNMQSLRDLGSILATLFIRTYERSERVYLAMKARGFEIQTTAKRTLPAISVIDVVFASAIIIPFVLFALL
jgi:cobalt/nickel transport system permease protein